MNSSSRLRKELYKRINETMDIINSPSSGLTWDQLFAYQISLMNDFDLLHVLNQACAEGFKEGVEDMKNLTPEEREEKDRRIKAEAEARKEQIRSRARELKAMGADVQQISKASLLSVEEIEMLFC